ncbi:hypothetical protein [uncultured Campylobacter sp.]|uniref:hypothetical protein n=1 Tax=uncultured Campylobacter sp. TaxID=218934 RepID=UPI002623B9F4|nr:hypothetical protein [uncultured Campylobacter sp.]
MQSSGAANFKNLRNFKAEYFGSSFGGKALPAVNFIAGRRRNLTLEATVKFNVAARTKIPRGARFARAKF